MNDVASFISGVGFPVFVAVWMLYKTSKDSESMKEAINELKIAITELVSKIDSIRRDDDNV